MSQAGFPVERCGGPATSSPLMSKRKTNRRRRRAKTAQLKAGEEIRALDPRASRDEAWAYYDLDLEFSRIKPPQAA
jgi:hypothetical protein